MPKLLICASEKTVEIVVGMGEMEVAVGSSHLLKAVGIGSCVTVTLYDRYTKTGIMAHIMIPCIEESSNRTHPGRFADVALDMMIDEIKSRGLQLRNIEARIYGGANMFPGIIASDSAMDIGKKNIRAVRDELARHNIRIISEDVGGHIGRTVSFDTGDGSVVVKTVRMEGKSISSRKYEEENTCFGGG